MAETSLVPVLEEKAQARSIQRSTAWINRTPLYISNPSMFSADQWRRGIATEPINRLCQKHVIREINALEWEIGSEDPVRDKPKIDHYKKALNRADNGAGWDVWVARMLKDCFTLPMAGNSEIGIGPNGVEDLWHVDGATLWPTFDDAYPYVQINPFQMNQRVYFGREDLIRLIAEPRVELDKKDYQEAPTETAFLAIEALSRIYLYNLKQLGDTPLAGVLDLMDMQESEAVEWAGAFREMMEGVDPLKIPILYDHTKPAKFIAFGRTPQDLNIIEQFKRFAELVCSAYGLSIGDLRLFEHERVLAGAEASQRVTARSGVGFWAQLVEDLITNKVLSTDVTGLKFKFQMGLIGEDQAKANLAQTRVQTLNLMTSGQQPMLDPGDALAQAVDWKIIDIIPKNLGAREAETLFDNILGNVNEVVSIGGDQVERVRQEVETTRRLAAGTEIESITENLDAVSDLAGDISKSLGGRQNKAETDIVDRFMKFLGGVFGWVGEHLDVDDMEYAIQMATDVSKATPLQDALDDFLSQKDWYALPNIVSQLTDIMKDAYTQGALQENQKIADFLYANKWSNTANPPLEFQLKNKAAIRLLEDHAAEMIKNVNNGTRFYLRQMIVTGVDNGWNKEEIIDYVKSNLFGLSKKEQKKLSDARIRSIVNTEMTWAHQRAAFDDRSALGLMTKQWYTAGFDVCDICVANEAEGIVPVDFEYQSVFPEMIPHPPAHPNTCKCSVQAPVEEIKQRYEHTAPEYWKGDENENIDKAMRVEMERLGVDYDEWKAGTERYREEYRKEGRWTEKHLPGRHNQKEHGNRIHYNYTVVSGSVGVLPEEIQSVQNVIEDLDFDNKVIEQVLLISREEGIRLFGTDKVHGRAMGDKIVVVGGTLLGRIEHVTRHEIGHVISHVYPSLMSVYRQDFVGTDEYSILRQHAINQRYSEESIDREIFANAYALSMNPFMRSLPNTRKFFTSIEEWK
jgi:hypothetical protein